MDKRLKIGLYCMAGAVVLMPIAVLCRKFSETLMFTLLFLTMFLELIGLVFVVLSIIKKKSKP